jgi:hypothetical protein
MRSKKDLLNSNRERTIRAMVNDITYLADLGITGSEAYESIDISNYSYRATKEDKIEAFRRCGYTVEEE